MMPPLSCSDICSAEIPSATKESARAVAAASRSCTLRVASAVKVALITSPIASISTASSASTITVSRLP